MRRYRQEKANGSARDVLGIVFEQMRKRGYLARMNFMCCGGCAGGALATKAEELKDKGKPVSGVMFWHRQDEEHYQESGRMFLRYGVADTTKHGPIGKDTVEVGRELVELITKVAAEHHTKSVTVAWDGDGSSCIEVLDAGLLEREAKEKRDREEREARWEAERKAREVELEQARTAFFGEGI